MPDFHLTGLILILFMIPYFLTKSGARDRGISASLLLASMGFFLGARFLISSKNLWLQSIPPVLPLLFGPQLYLYLMQFLQSGNSRKYTWIHFLPAFIMYVSIVSQGVEMPDLAGNPPGAPMPENWILMVLGPLTMGSLFAYPSMGLFRIYRLSQQNKTTPDIDKTMGIPKRLVFVTSGFLVSALLLVLLEFIVQLPTPLFPTSGVVHGLTSLFFILIFAYTNLQLTSITLSDVTPGTGGQPYEKSLISDELLDRYRIAIEDLFQTEKPYLNERFSVSDLEKRTGIPGHHLSQVFSRSWNTSFHEYLNLHRINEVIARLEEPEFAPYPILRIALECGFNSKASFNRNFKKFTGKTPSEYRVGLSRN